MSGLGDAPFRLRPGRRDDAGACSAIEGLCAAQFAESPRPGFAALPPAPPGAYAALADRGDLIVAEGADGAVIGFAALEPEAETLHLRELDVTPRQQGRGAGRRLVEAAVGRARAAGRRALTLTTWADVAWNAPVYRRMGFAPLPEAAWTPLCRQDVARLRRGGFDVSARLAMIRPV